MVKKVNSTPAKKIKEILALAAVQVPTPRTSKNDSDTLNIIQRLTDSYTTKTSTYLKALDTYMVFVVMTGITQFIYMLLVGTFPYNTFLSGFIGSVGTFILAGNSHTQFKVTKIITK